MTTLVVNENVFRRAKMRKLSIFLTLALVLVCGSSFAQITGLVYIGDVTGDFSPTQFQVGQSPTIRIDYDGTGLRGYEPGSPPTHGNWIYTTPFIIHGDGDWGQVISRRLTDAQRQLVEAGPMSFTTGIVNSLWLKVGGSGGPTFGAPGSALGEGAGQVFSGPIGGNGTGSDTVGILPGLTATGAADGWNPATHPVSQRYRFELGVMDVADAGKFICIDTITQPLGAWEWAGGLAGELVGLDYDNGTGSGDTRCWEIFEVPNLGGVITNCPGNYSFSHCAVGTFNFDGEDADDIPTPGGPVTFHFAAGNDAGGTLDPNTGVWTWAGAPQSGNFTLAVEARDGLGMAGAACVVNVTVTNQAPSITCPAGPATVSVGSPKAQTVEVDDDCDVLVVTDDGSTVGNVDLVDNGDGTWDVIYTPDSETDASSFEVCVSDGELQDCCTLNWNIIVGAPYQLQIAKLHDVFQGQFWNVPIMLNKFDVAQGLGGFDLLIAYDASALSFQEAFPGDIYAECGWEYFTYSYGATGNCSGSCPSGLVRVVGIAESNNGPNHPSGCAFDYVETVPVSLAELRFLVSNDRTLECQYVPIRFFWYDCGDNTLSNHDGSELYLSDKVFDYVSDDDFFNAGLISNGTVGFPTFQGAQDECVNDDPERGKVAKRYVDMQNGGIDIVCADSIDARGDINLNGIGYEIADAVMFTNYFISGLSAFGTHIEGSIAASDVNADGLALSVADLVYLIRVVIGDALPHPKVNALDVNYAIDGNVVRVDAPMGAAYVTVSGNATPRNLTDNMDMSYGYDAERNVTRVLVYSNVEGEAGRTFAGNFLNAGGRVLSVEFATYDGQPVAAKSVPVSFAVHQNYPNPFNPSTTFSFDMPKAGEWTINVYNVTGQLVETLGGASEAGVVDVVWNAERYASGIYFYKVTVDENSVTKKAVLIK
jgi:hypothetical protein